MFRFHSIRPANILHGLIAKSAGALLLASPVTAATVVFSDDFESGNTAGWTFVDSGSTVNGEWEIGTPIATFVNDQPAQPGSCPSGTKCAFTEQNPTGSAGGGDVDMGIVWLISPEIDLSEFSTAELQYQRWYYLRDLGEDDNDYFKAEIRPDDLSPWVTLEFLDNSQPHNAWTLTTLSLQEFVPLTSTVQIRFAAADAPDGQGGNIVEAAIDDVLITADSSTGGCQGNQDCAVGEYCNSQDECAPYGDGDCDADSDIDIADYACLQVCYGMPAEGACETVNLAGDGTVGPEDYITFSSLLIGPN